MTREEFEGWKHIRRDLYHKLVLSSPLHIGRFVLFSSLQSLGGIIELDRENNIIDGYTLFSHYEWGGVSLTKSKNVNTQGLIA